MAIAPYAITALSLTAETFRQAPSSFIAGTGVVGTGDYQVTQQSPANMSVNVAAGQAWVPGTLSSTTGFPANLNAQTTWGLPSSFNEQGCYAGWLNGTVNLAISAADPTNPRVDLVVVSVQDAQYAGSNNQMVPQIITGTPAPSPSPPNAPASSLVLAQVAVAANATSITSGNITDERKLFMPGPLSSSPYRARVYRNAAWTTTTGPAPPNYDANTYDPGSYFNFGTTLFTCSAAGDYSVKALIGATATAVNQYLYLQILHNGSVYSQGAQYHSVGTNDLMVAGVNDEVFQCAAGDTLGINYACSVAGLTGAVGPAFNWAVFRYLGR